MKNIPKKIKENPGCSTIARIYCRVDQANIFILTK